MLARVRWRGERWTGKANESEWEYGTLLQIVYESLNAQAYVAWDGFNASTRGKIKRVDLEKLTVTTRFKWTKDE